jgi:hypothetical protein
MLPVLAPMGTGTTMVVSLHLVGAAGVLSNVTVLDPCVAPKFVPVIVTGVFSAPELTDVFVITGGVPTVKVTPLLATPPTVTTMLPVLAPAGTGTAMVVSFQLVGVAGVLLNVTVLDPCVAPKFVPVIVTGVLSAPELTDVFVIAGAVPAVAVLACVTCIPEISTSSDFSSVWKSADHGEPLFDILLRGRLSSARCGTKQKTRIGDLVGITSA